MITIPLYTGGGVSLSPQNGPGRVLSAYIRAIADKGKALQKDSTIVTCIDILESDIGNWTEIDEPAPDPDAEITDYEEQLSRLGVTL